MGRALEIGMEVIGTKKSPRTNGDFAEKIEKLKNDAATSKITRRERLHVEAVQLAANGNFPEAAEKWEEILIDFPTDVIALKHAQTAYVFTGDSKSLRDSPVQVWKHWKRSMPLYGHIEGMMAFGYEEMRQFQEAETHAKSALEINRQDGWAAHAIAHVKELQGKLDEGIRFLESTSEDWKSCSWVAGHNYWHWAVMQLENLDYDAALSIFDDHIEQRTAQGSMLDISNSTALLYRLELEGVDVGRRWESIADTCEKFLNDHITSFNDAHVLMPCLASSQFECSKPLVAEFMESLENYARLNEKSPSVSVAEDVGLPLVGGMVAYAKRDYATASNILIPIYNQIYRIGGSHAQRDVFSQLVIRSCLKSPDLNHRKRGRELVLTRQKMKPNSPLTERMACHLKSIHV